MVPVKEPLMTEDIENLEDRSPIYPGEGTVRLWRESHRAVSSVAGGSWSRGRRSATAGAGRERMKTHDRWWWYESKKPVSLLLALPVLNVPPCTRPGNYDQTECTMC